MPENWTTAPNRMMWPVRFPAREKAFEDSEFENLLHTKMWMPSSDIGSQNAFFASRSDVSRRTRSASTPHARKTEEKMRMVHLRRKTEVSRFKSNTLLDRVGLTEELESWLTQGKPFERVRTGGKLAKLTGEPGDASRETIFSAEDFDEFIAHPFVVDARNKPLGYFT